MCVCVGGSEELMSQKVVIGVWGQRGNSHQDNTLATVSRGTIAIQYKEAFADNEPRRLSRGCHRRIKESASRR